VFHTPVLYKTVYI